VGGGPLDPELLLALVPLELPDEDVVPELLVLEAQNPRMHPEPLLLVLEWPPELEVELPLEPLELTTPLLLVLLPPLLPDALLPPFPPPFPPPLLPLLPLPLPPPESSPWMLVFSAVGFGMLAVPPYGPPRGLGSPLQPIHVAAANDIAATPVEKRRPITAPFRRPAVI
jgi:hypothetical protein